MRKKKIEFEDGNKLTSSLCGLKYKDLFRYFSVIGKYHFLEKKIFKDGLWEEFSRKGKELAKQLEVDGLLDESEFSELKGKIINQDSATVSSFEELRTWKKLYDQQILSEKEFSELKSKILK